MSQNKQKEGKKRIGKSNPGLDAAAIVSQLKKVIKSLNNFLKINFQLSHCDPYKYTEEVKQYFSCQSANSTYPDVVTSLFSKISCILQPISKSKSKSETDSDSILRQQISALTQQLEKRKRKMQKLRTEMNDYKQKSNLLTRFVYMLRVHNIDVDSLYDKLQREQDGEGYDLDLDLSISQTAQLKQPDLSNFQTQ